MCVCVHAHERVCVRVCVYTHMRDRMSECVCVPVKPVSRNEEPYFSRAWNRFAQVEVQERRELCYFWSVGEHLSLAVNEGDKQQFSF